MFEETLARIGSIVPDEKIYVVVNSLHSSTARRLLGRRSVKVLEEPVARNTAPCIGLAALHIERLDPEEPIVVLPSDHFIADRNQFARTLEAAAEVARSGCIVTLGAAPTRPETGYGYIEAGEKSGSSGDQPYCRVTRFVEKPDAATALNYVSSGKYLWNCGIFVFTAATILGEIRECGTDLSSGLRAIGGAIATDNYQAELDRVYAGFDSISIDYGVMEKTTRPLFVFPAQFGWSDVGSWQAVYELASGVNNPHQNVAMGEATFLDSNKNLVYNKSGREIALLGVEGLVVIDTPDALLVADINRSQDVKQIPPLLKAGNRGKVC